MIDRAIPSPLAPPLGAVELRYRPEWHEEGTAIACAHVAVDTAGTNVDLRFCRQVLDRATRDLSRWARHATTDFRLVASIAAIDLATRGFLTIVRQALHESAVAPATLVLAIEPDDATELTAIFDVIDDLRTLGVIVTTDSADGPSVALSHPLTADEFRTLLVETKKAASRPAKALTPIAGGLVR